MKDVSHCTAVFATLFQALGFNYASLLTRGENCHRLFSPLNLKPKTLSSSTLFYS